MKILQVGTGLDAWGGIERYVVYLARGLRDTDDEVLCTCRPGSPLSKRFPGETLEIPVRGKLDLNAILTTRKVIRRNKVEVVHLHFTPDIYIGALAARLAGCKAVVMSRHVAERWVRGKAVHYAGLLHQIIAVSNAVASTLLESGVPQTKITVAKAGCPQVVPSGALEDLRGRLGFEGFSFALVGRLTKEKGVDVAIDASKVCKHRLEIVGGGPEESALRRLAAGEDQIRFRGEVESADSFMLAMDCLVVPSRWAEAFPFSVLEAMSAGKPVIASSRGGLPELVSHGQTGILVEADNARSLAEAMNTVAASPLKAQELGRCGEQVYKTNYTIPHMAHRIREVYEELRA